MSDNKCCGNCKHFQNESATGNGWCNENDWISNVDKVCKCHEDIDNGWTEITTDNVDEINADLIVVTDGTYYKMANDWHVSLSTLAKVGGYYYYVLPELTLED